MSSFDENQAPVLEEELLDVGGPSATRAKSEAGGRTTRSSERRRSSDKENSEDEGQSQEGTSSKKKSGRKKVVKEPPPVQVPLRRPKDTADLPPDIKKHKLLACMICSLVKTHAQFQEDGCDNCERTLRLAGEYGSVYLYTSENFEGMIGVMEPRESWVTKWQHLQDYKKGIYAVNVVGVLPKDILRQLVEAGIHYVNRDKGKDQLKAQAMAAASISVHQREADARRREKAREMSKKNSAKKGSRTLEDDLLSEEEEESAVLESKSRTGRGEKKYSSNDQFEYYGDNAGTDSDSDSSDSDSASVVTTKTPCSSLTIIHGKLEGKGADVYDQDED